MTYVKDIFKDEIRDGFLVTSDRKKIWEKEIDILLLIDKICKENDIKYFVDYGTLLGTIRHKGFIPWDDDLDIMMTRPDYMRFQEIALRGLPAPYHYQCIYTDGPWMFSKVRNSNTTGYEKRYDIPNMNQGLWVDIFPLDSVPDANPNSELIFTMTYIIYLMAFSPSTVSELRKQKGSELIVDDETLNNLSHMDYKERFKQFELFALSNYDNSENESTLLYYILLDNYGKKKSWAKDTILMPFENIEVPVPNGYDDILKTYYKDYSKFVVGTSEHNNVVQSADIPYKEYLQKISNKLLT